MSEFTGGKRTSDIDFGDYVEIEMYRYGVPNEFYLHKVIGAYQSTHYAKVPIQQGITGTGTESVPGGNGLEEVLNVVCCGIDEKEIFVVRKSDVRKVRGHTNVPST